MKSKTCHWIGAITLFSSLLAPAWLAGQTQSPSNQQVAAHHHYKLIDLGTFGGPGSTPTEFQQVLNNGGIVVGGADTSSLNPYPNCFNPFNQSVECSVQHAFEWHDGRLTDLGTLPRGSSSFAYFVSNDGLIAGGSENGVIDSVVGTPESRATLWRDGKVKDLGTLGGNSSVAFQVNDAGQVIGIAQNAIPDSFSIAGLGTQTRAFLWQNGEMHDLRTLGGPDSFPQYVNDRGQVAGVSYTSDTAEPSTGVPQLNPFLWENGRMKDLGNLGGANGGPFLAGLNNRGEVSGAMTVTGDQTVHAFLWDGEKLSDLHTLGGSFSIATGLNEMGEVIGYAAPPGDQVFHAFLWRNGRMNDLGTLGDDPCSTAESINSHGQIVGASQSACAFFTDAFLWENGGPSADLNTLVPSGSAMDLTGAFWINDRGEITGRGVPPGCGDVDTCGHAFVLIPCDEDHPGIEGCDYDPAYATTTSDVRPAQITRLPLSTANETKLSIAEMMARFRSMMARRYSRFGVLQRQ